jgi:hypothetical protein
MQIRMSPMNPGRQVLAWFSALSAVDRHVSRQPWANRLEINTVWTFSKFIRFHPKDLYSREERIYAIRTQSYSFANQ